MIPIAWGKYTIPASPNINEDPLFQRYMRLRQHDIDMFYVLNDGVRGQEQVYAQLALVPKMLSIDTVFNFDYAQTMFWQDLPSYDEIKLVNNTVAAVICVHDDNVFLKRLLLHLDGNVAIILVMVGMKPWNGGTNDRGVKATLSIVEEFIQFSNNRSTLPGTKLKTKTMLIPGYWSSEGGNEAPR